MLGIACITQYTLCQNNLYYLTSSGKCRCVICTFHIDAIQGVENGTVNMCQCP